MTPVTAHTIAARPPGGQPLAVKAATVTLDEGWSPYVQAELVCTTPDTATLALLDPRTDPPPRLWLDLVTAYTIAARLSAISADYALGPATVRTNLRRNPRAGAATQWAFQPGPGEAGTFTRLTATDGPLPGIGTSYRWTVTTAKTNAASVSGTYVRDDAAAIPGKVGDQVAVSVYVRTSVAYQLYLDVRPRLAGVSGGARVSVPTTCPAGVWTRLTHTFTSTGAFDEVQIFAAAADTVLPVGATLEATAAQVELAATVGTYLDGDLADTPPTVDYAWTGTPHASWSTLSTRTAGTLAAVSGKYTGRTLAAISADYATAYTSGVVPSPTTRRLDVHVRSRTVDLATGELRLTVASDEHLMQDYTPVLPTVSTPASNTVRDAVALVLAYTVPGAVLPPGPDAAIDPAAAPWAPGMFGWDYLSPLVTAAELRLWCDESRTWHLDVPATGTGGTLALTAAGNLVHATEELSRDGDWYAAVYVSWQTTTNTTTGLPITPGAVAGRQRGRTLVVRYPDTPYPAGLTPSGTDTARALLTRAQTRGRVLTLAAVSDYTATPGQAVTVTVPGQVVVAGMLSAVSWSFPDDEMTVRTRDLVDAGVLAQVGVD